METRDYDPFDKPAAVALAMANALILFARTIAEREPSLALSTLKRVHCKLAVMLADLNVSERDCARVDQLMNETEAMLAGGAVRH
jgi:hypothetical protein